jgi:hypothetical protein
MAHRTVRCATGHCPVRQPRHPTVRVRPLELLTCGPPDSPVVHRTAPVHCPVRLLAPALTLHAQSALFTVHCSRCRHPLTQVAIAPLGTPDSPVNYSGVVPRITEGGKFGVDLPGAPDTVRWCTVAHQIVRCARPGQPSVVFLLFLFEPFLGLFYWFVLNLWHL